MSAGSWIMREAERLAVFSESTGLLTRRYLTAEHRAAGEHIAGLMREAGLSADFDALGNVVGRLEGRQPGHPPVLVGSHMDTVRNAGRYDGPLGILTGIAALKLLKERGVRLKSPVEVIAFGDEEGTRFGVTMIGSRALVGRFDPAWLAITGDDGVTLGAALSSFGGKAEGIPSLDRRRHPPAAYLEVHIEQGPVLEREGLPVGIVTAIAGASRLRAVVKGLAGHAGTVPMAGRRDALVAAARMVQSVAQLAASVNGLVATVGRLEVLPNVTNVIPGEVTFTVDLRHGEDRVRLAAVRRLKRRLHADAARDNVALSLKVYYEQVAAVCDPALVAQLAAAVERAGVRALRLPSGAGHDAMELARIAPMAMLFVRSGNGGISHHPDEIISAEDAGVAVEVLADLLAGWG